MAKHYTTMDAFTATQDFRTAEAVARILSDAGAVIPDLHGIRAPLVDHIITDKRYALNVASLRIALDRATTSDAPADTTDAGENPAADSALDPGQDVGISLDRTARLRATGVGNVAEAVYDLCLSHPDLYLKAVEADGATSHAIAEADTLVAVLTDIAAPPATDEAGNNDTSQGQWIEHWDDALVARLLAQTAPSARLDTLGDAPKATWTQLAKADLFEATLANVEAYLDEIGTVDEALGSLLTAAGRIAGAPDVGPPDLDEVTVEAHEAARAAVVPTAVAVINATSIDTGQRVALAKGLNPRTPLPATDITAGPDDLFALAIEAGLVADDETTFARLREGGWAALGPAIGASHHFADFDVTTMASITSGMVAEVLTDPADVALLEGVIVSNVDLFVPEDAESDAAATAASLREIAAYAKLHDTPLTPHTAVRIAAAGAAATPDVLKLLREADPAPAATDIVEAFRHCGGKYAKVATPGAKFQLPKDDLHEPLLKTLNGAVADVRKATGREIYNVQMH